MKKQIFTLFAVALFIQLNAQNLREIIRGSNGVSQHSITLDLDKQIAFSPIQAKTIFGLDFKSDLVLEKGEPDDLGFIHYRYYQTYKNVTIENSMYIVHTKNGKLIGMDGAVVVDFDSRIDNRSSLTLTQKQAIDAAVQYVHADKYMWEDDIREKQIKVQTGDPNASYFPTANLVWYNNGPDINPHDLQLAYKVDVYAETPLSRAYYFVDAQAGKILGKNDELFFVDAVGKASTFYSGSKNIHSDFNGTDYNLRDLTKGKGIITLHGEVVALGNNYTSATADWTLAGDDVAALDAHYSVSQTYAFYKKFFRRNSYDGKGAAIYSYVNDPLFLDQAYWDGTKMSFCKRSDNINGGVTGIDICGHELTHAVIKNTSKLNYSSESGAINESISDIMGKSVQFWSKPKDINWQISNDILIIGRDMSNPKLYGDPDTYLGKNWYKGADENVKVHTNSGVGNFFFYLLSEGGSGTNDNNEPYSVTKLGFLKADSIIYRTLTVYLNNIWY